MISIMGIMFLGLFFWASLFAWQLSFYSLLTARKNNNDEKKDNIKYEIPAIIETLATLYFNSRCSYNYPDSAYSYNDHI